MNSGHPGRGCRPSLDTWRGDEAEIIVHEKMREPENLNPVWIGFPKIFYATISCAFPGGPNSGPLFGGWIPHWRKLQRYFWGPCRTLRDRNSGRWSAVRMLTSAASMEFGYQGLCSFAEDMAAFDIRLGH